MLTLLSSIFGIVSGLLPGLLRMWERRYEQRHELDMLRTRLEGMAKGVEIVANVEDGRTLVREGDSLRTHDLALTGDSPIETLRASVRPVITYSFFGLFCFIKAAALIKMLILQVPTSEILTTIWGQEETVLLAAVLSFWFGSRITTKLEELDIKRMNINNKNN
jgi:hypothetical protein